MKNNTPIHIYDSRKQFTEPEVTVYDDSRLEAAKQFSGVPDEFVYVSRVRMHPYEPTDPYKVSQASKQRSSCYPAPPSRSERLSKTLGTVQKENLELRKKNAELELKAKAAEDALLQWEHDNIEALKALAVKLLTSNVKQEKEAHGVSEQG